MSCSSAGGAADKHHQLLQEETKSASGFSSSQQKRRTHPDQDFTCENSRSRPAGHLERVPLDEDDDLERRAGREGAVAPHLLPTPALVLQRVAHHARRLVEPRVEVERHVGPRLDAAATGEVHLEPGRQAGTRCWDAPAHAPETGRVQITCRRPTAQIPGSEPFLQDGVHPGWSQRRGASVGRTGRCSHIWQRQSNLSGFFQRHGFKHFNDFRVKTQPGQYL